jgi:hypothetical protein
MYSSLSKKNQCVHFCYINIIFALSREVGRHEFFSLMMWQSLSLSLSLSLFKSLTGKDATRRTAASAAVTALVFFVGGTRCRVLPLLGTHVEKGRPDSRGLLAAVQGPLAFASLLTGSTRVLEFAGRRCHNARAEREREGVTVVMMMILYQSFLPGPPSWRSA